MLNLRKIMESLIVVAVLSAGTLVANDVDTVLNDTFQKGLEGWGLKGKVSFSKPHYIDLDCNVKGKFTAIQRRLKNIRVGDVLELCVEMKSDSTGGQAIICEGGKWGEKQALFSYKKGYYRNKGQWQKVIVRKRITALPVYIGAGLYKAPEQVLQVKSIQVDKLKKMDSITLREAANPWNTTFMPHSDIYDKAIFKPYGAVNVYAAGNEYAVAAIMAYNPLKENIYVTARLQPENASATGIGMKNIFIREALHIRARLGQLTADPLPLISRDQIVSLPSGECRQLLVEFYTGNLTPGTYKYKLSIKGLDDHESVEIPVNFTVLPFSLTRRHPLDIMTWDCSLANSKGDLQVKILDMLRSGRVNTFHVLAEMKARFKSTGAMVGSPDFSELDRLLKVLGTENIQVWLRGGRYFRSRNDNKVLSTVDGKGIKIYSPEWRLAFKSWLIAVRDYMEAKGYKKSQWCFYPFDEYLGKHYLKIMDEIRNVDPGMRIFANPADPRKENSSFENIMKMAENKNFDILCPVFGKYYPRNGYDKVSEKLKQLGIKQYFYYCPVVQKRLSPINFYREMGWRMYHYDFDGGGYWTSTGIGTARGKGDWGGNPWNDFDAKTASPVTIYNFATEVVPSRRWLAFRAGLEDYCYIAILQQHLSRVELDKLLGESSGMPRRSYYDIQNLREKMINKILGAKRKSPICFEKPDMVADNWKWNYLVGRDLKESMRLKLMLENYLQAAPGHLHLPIHMQKEVTENSKLCKELLRRKKVSADMMPEGLEKIGVEYNKIINPENITVDKNGKAVIRLKLYNLAVPYSVWAAVQMTADGRPVNLPLEILNGKKKFKTNEAGMVQIPANSSTEIEITIPEKNVRSDSLELIIFPLDHLNNGAIREIKIKSERKK